MHEILKLFLFLCGMGCSMILLSSCMPKFDTTTPELQIPVNKLTTNTFVGIWMIDQQTIDKMITEGFKRYTNRSDHILILNPDGSCIYRSFSGWWGVWDAKIYDEYYQECAGLNNWPGETTYYEWNPYTDAPLQGPLVDTNNASIGSVHINHYKRWCIYDRATSDEDERCTMMARYYIKFYNHTGNIGKEFTTYPALRYLTWNGTNITLNCRGTREFNVRFQKITTNELFSIIRADYPKP